MEKIAVDLEKVLDDFEKEQLHMYFSSQATINNTCNSNYTIFPPHYRPASNYRRPPFEPVNLLDADFSVSASPLSVQIPCNYLLSNSYSNSRPKAYDSSENDSVLKNWIDEKPKEFKPDLIESNIDSCANLNEFDRFERHLPDIASTDVEVRDETVDFDLITNSIDNMSNSTASDSSNQVFVRFPIISDISDHELPLYLEELEEEEFNNSQNNLIAKISQENLSDNISINSEFDLCDLYAEKNEIAVEDVYERSEINNEIKEEETERSILSLNTMTGCVVSLKMSEESSYADEKKTETSIMEVNGITDELCATNNNAENKTSIEEPVEVTVNSSLQSVDTQSNEFECYDKEKTFENVEPLVEECGIFDQQSYDKSCDDHFQGIVTEKNSNTHIAISNGASLSEDSEMTNALYFSNISSPEGHSTSNNFVSTSDSNYQILDSKMAISTFEQSDDVRTSTSTDVEYSNAVNEVRSGTSAGLHIKVQRPDSLNLMHATHNSDLSTSADSGSLLSMEERKLGREPPFWIPDSGSTVCMHCHMKFTMVKRRHHCRACGLVLCSKCCDMKASLEYLGFEEARVCRSCHSILEKISSVKRPNPNNPMEYCSTIPPLLQVGPAQPTPPSVLVPVVGVLKREGRVKTNDVPKQVIFSDGIRPGGDLTELDTPIERRLPLRKRVTKRVGTPPDNIMQHRRLLNPKTHSFIPSNNDLPALVTRSQGEYVFSDLEKPLTIEDDPIKFIINYNLFVMVKKLMLDCCVNREVWCMTTDGLSCVSQDEVIFILEVLPDEQYPPKDIFCIVNLLYQEASKGITITEMSFVAPCLNQLFGSKEHGGFVFIRPTYQCIQKLPLPKSPFLIALLVHRWETPWARLFPIRLILRLGAEYRYYPCPLISIRDRPALFTDIGHTIISLLADFRKYSYSLPAVRGLMIHMEDRLTTILLPRNRYDQVIRAINNSGENVLAFAGNISTIADSHLVCIQSTQDDTSYHTQAINIHNKPRQVTGASFVVFNGSLKQCTWAGKSNIVEDGLMVQMPSESMVSLRNALKQMNDYSIGCGPQAEEIVVLKWAPDDVNFNIGVKSNIDNRPLNGVPSIRVHNGIDYSGTLRLIRWTEVFILQSDEDSGSKTCEPLNISKLSESIARATCIALVPLLDLLATANLTTLAVRVTIDPEKVEYEAGSRGEKLPPLYMKNLDEELISVVHDAAASVRDTFSIVLELVFKVMEQG